MSYQDHAGSKDFRLLEVDAYEPSLYINNLSYYFDPSFSIHREPLVA
jgi:hypothetical protein